MVTKNKSSLPVVKIQMEITSCRKCPNFKTGNYWSSDGWDRMEDWICKKVDRTIQGSVEWHEESHIGVPDWCPLRITDEEESAPSSKNPKTDFQI